MEFFMVIDFLKVHWRLVKDLSKIHQRLIEDFNDLWVSDEFPISLRYVSDESPRVSDESLMSL